MTDDEELRFMEMLIQMGFGREYVTWAMYHLSRGNGFGWSMMRSVWDTTSQKEFPRDED